MDTSLLRAACVALLIFVAQGIHAEDFTPLPFGVKIGGQEAKPKKDAVFAEVANPVASDAELEVDVKDSKMIIVNFFPADDAGNLKAGGTPAILIIQNSNKGPISKTMDNKPLASGGYRANIVADQKTAIVFIKVK